MQTWFGLETWMWIAIEAAVAVGIVAIVIVALSLRARSGRHEKRTSGLRDAFGPEYARTVDEKGQSAAENDLDARTQRAGTLDVHALSSIEGQHYSEAWAATQARFVDSPAEAVTSADRLVIEVLQARGYPTANFEDGAQAVSVDHPRVVVDYRAAHEAAERSQRGAGSTEDLREAMIRYRQIFTEILDVRGSDARQPIVAP